MKKNFIKIIILSGALVVIGSILTLNFLKKNNSTNDVKDKKAKESAIEQYLINENQNAYSRSAGSKFFCAAEVLWEYSLSDTEKIVYAPNSCASVLVIDGDLRASGGGGEPPLFKMEYKNNAWKVVDMDNRRLSPNEPITQDWVRDAQSKVPKDVLRRSSGNKPFSTDGVINQAAAYFKVKLPEYPLNSCKTDRDCASDSFCAISGDHSNQVPNTCVKKCAKNSDCGIAHTCRYQCIHGENGCPDTAEKICIPDLLASQVEKDPNSFVGFTDFEIPRRRAIAEAHPEFPEDFEKKNCFAGCSVKVIEDARVYYYAFILHGSGLPILKASCFRVEGTFNFKVSKIGEYPDVSDLNSEYKDVDPKTCKGIK